MKLLIGEKIRQHRHMCALTQSELASKLKVDSRTISSWEKNRTEPKTEQIETMAKIFGCTYRDLTGYSNDLTVDIAVPEYNAMLELYNSLNAEQKNMVLLYMIDLKMR